MSEEGGRQQQIGADRRPDESLILRAEITTREHFTDDRAER